MNKSSGRGPRVGRPDTRESIRNVAQRRFLADGYQMVTLRSIAAEAGVDVALVSYYFGSKKGLFAAALALPANPVEVFQHELQQGDLDTLAVRVLERVLFFWDGEATGATLLTFAQAAVADPDLNRLVREVISREIVDRLAERLGGVTGGQRAAAFVSQIAGLIFSRYVLKLEPMADLPSEVVVRQLAPSLQLLLLPPRRRPVTG
jgi:AcrR family transcriptional regulator